MPENAVLQRIALVHDHWLGFVEQADARLFCLRVTSDEEAVAKGFVANECDPESGRLPDFFLSLGAAFESAAAHGAQLLAELVLRLDALGAAQPDEDVEAAREGSPAVGGADANAGTSAYAPVHAWRPPPFTRKESPTAHFARSMDEFAQVAVPAGLLCLVLQPERLADRALYQAWLAELLPVLPQRVRVMVIEPVEDPALVPWIHQENPQVMVCDADLDMLGARAAISASVGDGDTPHGRFRNGFVAMTNQLAEGEVESARQQAVALIALAEGAGWYHLVVPVHFAIASGLLQGGDYAGSLQAYEAAETAANAGAQATPRVTHARAEAATDGAAVQPGGGAPPRAADPVAPSSRPPGAAAMTDGSPKPQAANSGKSEEATAKAKADPQPSGEPFADIALGAEKDFAAAMAQACNNLRLPARLSQGSVMVAAGDYLGAAAFFERAVALTDELGDQVAKLDCQRLASFCYMQGDEPGKAWRAGLQAMETGRALPDDKVAISTMPFLGDHLLRMTEQLAAYGAHGRPLLKELNERLGPDWRPKS